MGAVFDGPVGTHDRPQQVRRPCQGRDVKACLSLDLIGQFARALDHDDGFQSGPIVALLQPGYVMEHGVGSGFDAAMVAVDRLIPADLCRLCFNMIGIRFSSHFPANGRDYCWYSARVSRHFNVVEFGNDLH